MEGKVGRAELLEAEAKSYHSPGTCTFYGTANSNQMLMEIMGLHLPGASFVNPGTPLRDALTREATRRALSLTAEGNDYTPIGHIIDEKAIVNGLVGLHATGGSTNHTLHLVAIAAAAGMQVTWEDMSRPLRRRAAAGPRLSQRHRRREPLPRRRRHGLPDPRTARRPAICTRTSRPSGATGLSDYAVEAKLHRGQAHLRAVARASPATPRCSPRSTTPFAANWRAQAADGQSRQVA